MRGERKEPIRTRTVARRLVAALMLSLVVQACAPEASPPRNIILVSIDTLRADRLGCYGHDRPTSPAIDLLAAEGVLFEDASATSPWTKPSHASLLTGLYPSRNGMTSMESTMPDRVRHIAEWLGQQGFQTAAVVNSQWLTSHGLERGYEQLESIDYVQGRREGSPVTEAAIDWLEARNRDKRFLLMVHYMDVHSDYTSLPRYEQMFVEPYAGGFTGATQQLYQVAEGRLRPDERDLGHLRNLYDAGIRQIDDRVGALIDYLRRDGLLENSLVVLTSDHGEEFLEHGSMIHGFTQFQEVIRIPMIFHGPGLEKGIRVDTPVSLIDVMPTILDLLDLPIPADLDGVALFDPTEPVAGAAGDRLLYFEADVTFPPPGPGPVPPGHHRAVRSGRYKLHLRTDVGGYLLYDLATDPAERQDVTSSHPEIVNRLRARLEAYLGDAGESQEREFTDEELERLRSLGYVR